MGDMFKEVPTDFGARKWPLFFVRTTSEGARARSVSGFHVRVAVALNDDGDGGGGMIGHRSPPPPPPPPPLSVFLPAPPKFEFIMRVGKLGSNFPWAGRWVVTFLTVPKCFKNHLHTIFPI